MKVWQIATGEPRRDYRQIFTQYDLMILGPGNPGHISNFNYAVGASNSILRQIHHFAHDPKPGDRVLMRIGHKVIGVGQIPDGNDQYSHNQAFRCVYGWNLQHCRRVIWGNGIDLSELQGVYQDAKQKPSFTQVHESHIVELVRKIDSAVFDRPLKSLPAIDTTDFTEEDLGKVLFQAGISNRNISEIIKALQQAARLCAWYQKIEAEDQGKLEQDKVARPSEHEIISHIVLPIFLALGWSHQQIAVEWRRVDMAFFRTTPTTADQCVMVLEAKGLGQALSDVLEQPKKYVENLQLTKARYILTTDGPNLFIYCRNGQEWTLVGYLNFLSLQKQYVLPENTDLVQTLVRLQPNMISMM